MAYQSTGNPLGRPLLYSREKTDAILERYASGETNIKGAAILAGIKPSTFFNWLYDDVDGLRDRYTRAQGIRALMLRDEVLEILDDSRNDYVEKHTRNGTFVQLDRENIKRSELRAKYRQELGAKALPGNLGGLSDVRGGGEIHIHIDAADAAY